MGPRYSSLRWAAAHLTRSKVDGAPLVDMKALRKEKSFRVLLAEALRSGAVTEAADAVMHPLGVNGNFSGTGLWSVEVSAAACDANSRSVDVSHFGVGVGCFNSLLRGSATTCVAPLTYVISRSYAHKWAYQRPIIPF